MKEIRETVDHRDRCVTRYLLQGLLGKSTHDEEIHPPTETAGTICWSLPHPEVDLGGTEKNRTAP
jgi:hypothetical protein